MATDDKSRKVNASLITGVVNEIKSYEKKIGMKEYEACLALLVKCVHDYSNKHKRPDAKALEEVVSEVKAQEISEEFTLLESDSILLIVVDSLTGIDFHNSNCSRYNLVKYMNPVN
jgi:hypothetical protein